MGMNCEACLATCKADCCHGPVPMPRDYLDRFPVIRPVVLVRDVDEHTIEPLALYPHKRMHNAMLGVCPFLGLDNRCSIYEHRPDVCRQFGQAWHHYVVCTYQSHTGRVRPRLERKWAQREKDALKAAYDRLHAGRPLPGDDEREQRFMEEIQRLK